MNAQETELKLSIAPHQVNRLRDRIRRRLGPPLARKTLDARYFDSPGLDLNKAGISVRIRQGNGDFRQTVKQEGVRQGGLFLRPEWEWPISGPSLDSALLAKTGLPIFADPHLQDRLGQVFSTRVTREIWEYRQDETLIELALDLGELTTPDGHRSAAIHEVEWEIKSGPATNLFALAHQLTHGLIAAPLSYSKSDRGYLLAQALPFPAVKARPIPLNDPRDFALLGRTILHAALAQVVANHPAITGPQGGEAVHQMRVGLRRLRSANRLLRKDLAPTLPDDLQDRLKGLLSRLGPARDSQVFLDEIIQPALTELDLTDLGLPLTAHLHQHLGEDMANLTQALQAPEFGALMLDLAGWIESLEDRRNLDRPCRDRALMRLNKCRHRMMQAGGKHLDRLSAQDLHQVRILGKQWRYGREFFAGFLDNGESRALTRRLAELQDHLGLINDINLAQDRLAELAKQVPAMADPCARIAKWHRKRLPHLLVKAQEIWRALRD